MPDRVRKADHVLHYLVDEAIRHDETDNLSKIELKHVIAVCAYRQIAELHELNLKLSKLLEEASGSLTQSKLSRG